MPELRKATECARYNCNGPESNERDSTMNITPQENIPLAMILSVREVQGSTPTSSAFASLSRRFELGLHCHDVPAGLKATTLPESCEKSISTPSATVSSDRSTGLLESVNLLGKVKARRDTRGVVGPGGGGVPGLAEPNGL